MKKYIGILAGGFLLIFLTFNITVNANNIISLSASGTTASVTITGTTEAGTAAVMVQILSETDVVAMESFAVTGNSFTGTIDLLSLTAGNTYTVKTADYDGGIWESTTFIATAPPTPPPTPTPTPSGQDSSGSNNLTGNTQVITPSTVATTPATTEKTKKDKKKTTTNSTTGDTEEKKEDSSTNDDTKNETDTKDSKPDTSDDNITKDVDQTKDSGSTTLGEQQENKEVGSEAVKPDESNKLVIILIIVGIVAVAGAAVFTVIKIKSKKDEL